MSCGPAFVGLPSICIQVKRVKRDLKTGEDEFDDCRLRVLRSSTSHNSVPHCQICFREPSGFLLFYHDNFACTSVRARVMALSATNLKERTLLAVIGDEVCHQIRCVGSEFVTERAGSLRIR